MTRIAKYILALAAAAVVAAGCNTSRQSTAGEGSPNRREARRAAREAREAESAADSGADILMASIAGTLGEAAATSGETAAEPAAASPAAVPSATPVPAETEAAPAAKRAKIQSGAADKIRLVSFGGLSGGLFEGWTVKVTVTNNTSYNIVISEGRGEVYTDGSRTATAKVRGDVVLPRNATTEVSIPMDLSLSNPLMALSLYSRIKQKRFDGIEVSLSAEVSAGVIKRRIAQERVPVQSIMQKLGY